MNSEETQKETVASAEVKGTPKTAQPTSNPAMGGIFGISKDTKASNNAPIPVVKKIEPNDTYPTGYEFPIATLVNVVADPAFKRKDGTTAATLTFIFRDKDKRQHMHIEWEVDPSDAKFKDKADWLNTRLAHIYSVIFGQFPAGGIGTTATNYGEYFTMMADAFNNQVVEGKKVYTQCSLFLKLVYYKDNLGFPMSPNFIEKINPTTPSCKQLAINPRYDKLQATVSKAPAGMGGSMGGELPGELPDLDKEFE